MKIQKTTLQHAFLIKPCIMSDDRGTFRETFRKTTLEAEGVYDEWVQENCSTSKAGVIRGLHFQTKDPQAKLVTCLSGKILDIIIDLRVGSSTFGKHQVFELTGENELQLYVPQGFAHGFAVIEEAKVYYKCSTYWDKESDGGINPCDERFGYPWGIKNPIISPKDLALEKFSGKSPKWEIW
jgi:dTDP-4-dehydrorhamnose 3,5-epimerase